MKNEIKYHEKINPSQDEIAMHYLQIWLHGAHKLGFEEIGQPQFLSYVARDNNDTPVGGLLVKIQMKVIFIETFWVNPDFQKNGIGKELSLKLYEYAKNNQCEYMLASSYEFYDAINYLVKNEPLVEVIAKIENCPSPHTYYLFKRKL